MGTDGKWYAYSAPECSIHSTSALKSSSAKNNTASLTKYCEYRGAYQKLLVIAPCEIYMFVNNIDTSNEMVKVGNVLNRGVAYFGVHHLY